MQSLSWPRPYDEDINGEPRKRWTAYALFAVVMLLILCPQPSIVLLFTTYYLLVSRSKILFLVHLGVGYFLLFMMLSSLIVALARDPGPISTGSAEAEDQIDSFTPLDSDAPLGENISLTEALRSRGDNLSADGDTAVTAVKSNGEPRFCRKCWAPKPERCHHCSTCGRCVLKMDHHCPWLANRCVGVRTYPAFLHFLFTSTVYSSYMFGAAVPPIKYYLSRPYQLDERDLTPYHAMTIALMGIVFALSIGSFFVYHVYLVCTNQTTLESLAPYQLLRYLPPIPPAPTHNPALPSLEEDLYVRPPSFSSTPPSPTSTPSSSPPPYAYAVRRPRHFAEPYNFPSPPDSPTQPPRRLLEHQLTSKQRRLVREAAGNVRIFDLGWKENLREALGGPDHVPGRPYPSRWIWVERALWGGRPRGDGQTFRLSPSAERKLQELAKELATLG